MRKKKKIKFIRINKEMGNKKLDFEVFNLIFFKNKFNK